MAYNQDLEKRIGVAITLFPADIKADISRKNMFGGLAYLFKGKMTVGIVKEELVVRVVPEKMEDILRKPEVRPMNFTGKPMKEFIFVSEEGFKSEEQLMQWIELGLEHARRKLNLI